VRGRWEVRFRADRPGIACERPKPFTRDPEFFAKDPEFFAKDPEFFAKDPESFATAPEFFAKDLESFARDPESFARDLEFLARDSGFLREAFLRETSDLGCNIVTGQSLTCFFRRILDFSNRRTYLLRHVEATLEPWRPIPERETGGEYKDRPRMRC
jgi:hypothetical protein